MVAKKLFSIHDIKSIETTSKSLPFSVGILRREIVACVLWQDFSDYKPTPFACSAKDKTYLFSLVFLSSTPNPQAHWGLTKDKKKAKKE